MENNGGGGEAAADISQICLPAESPARPVVTKCFSEDQEKYEKYQNPILQGIFLPQIFTRPRKLLKPNHFKKQSSSSSLLLT